MKFSLSATLLAMGNMVLAGNSLPSIEVVGNKFFYTNNGSQFYIKGVAYQSNSVVNQTDATFNDPLSDPDTCKRDIPYLQQLGANLIRVYAINTTNDHSGCMSQLNDAGIYVLSDLSEPGLSISDADPQWNVDLYSRYVDVINALGNYSNVLGFFAGNEVINGFNGSDSAPFVRAAIRDSKAYIKQNFNRAIPVGFAASDVAGVRVPEADYFACGDESSSADFYGVNIYEWCGDSTYEQSGYAARTEEMKNMSRPLFFSEYGCNRVQPRKFTEVAALYGSNMTGVWSGGIVYEYFQEVNDYGLVSVSGNSVSTLADYNNLKTALAAVSPSSAVASAESASATTLSCPAQTPSAWNAATVLPPTPNTNVCGCLSPGSGCVVKDSVDETHYSDLFSYVCQEVSCAGINGNGTTGEYGAFVGCNPKDQLNYVLGLYYAAQSGNAQACDFSGSATTQSPKTTGNCAGIFSQAGKSGTGSVSAGSLAITGGSGAKATATGSGSGSGSGSSASGSGSSSGSSSAKSSGSSSSKNAAGRNIEVATGVLAVVGAVIAGFL